MSRYKEVELELEECGEVGFLSRAERAHLQRSEEFANLESGDYYDRDVAVLECANVIRQARSSDLRDRVRASAPLMDDAEGERVRAIAHIRHSAAREREDVRSFRSASVGRRLLTTSDAAAWIRKREPEEVEMPLRLAYQDRDRFRAVRVSARSELGELAVLSEVLSVDYDWPLDAATMFVLTDRIPIPKWVDAGIGGTIDLPRVELSIDPETPTAVVAKVYEQERAKVKAHRRRRSPDAMRLTSEWLALGRPSFAELARKWNERHPGHPYQRRSAQQAVERVWEHLTGEPLSP
ncbi:MAG: hypothetical protein ACK5O2_02050 [Microthrixaceae bacterium]